MTCQDCGTLLPTDQTIRGYDVDMRVHTCACGSRFMSEQRITRRLTPVMGKPNTHKRGANSGQAPPIQGTNPPSSDGGFGGNLPSGSDPGSDPNPKASLLSEPRARAKSNEPANYTAEFEIVWEQTGRRGGKFPAYRAWKKVGRPSWLLIQVPWRAYLLSEHPRNGFVKDLSSWLNARGHEQEWQPATPKIVRRLDINVRKEEEREEAVLERRFAALTGGGE